MQKALRIRLQASRSALKYADKKKLRKHAGQVLGRDQQQRRIDNLHQSRIQDERTARREDWQLGPLAPNRDYGLKKGRYGTLDHTEMRRPEIPDAQRIIKARKNGYSNTFGFKGSTIVGNVVVNDRVAVVSGPPHVRNKIGYVLRVDEDSEMVTVSNVNVADITMPDWIPQPENPHDPNSKLFQSNETLLPMKDLRLIVQLADEQGNMRDVLVRHVHADGPYQDRPQDSPIPNHTRYISGTSHLTQTGTNIVIPWPETTENVEAPAEEDSEETTSLTWHPSLYWPSLGYIPDRAQTDLLEDPRAVYHVGDVAHLPYHELSSVDRAGHRGLIDGSPEARIWIDKVSAGIMKELDGLNDRRRTTNMDVIKAKMLADARSHWWEQRQALSPQTEAQLKKVEDMSKLRLSAVEENTKTLATNIDKLVASVQSLEMKPKFKRDPKLKRTLAHETKAEAQQSL